MKIKIIMTGSDGNCCLLMDKGTNILIDAGFHTKTKMEKFLGDILEKIPIHAILITHEHNDHFSPWTGRLSIDKNIPIYLHKKHYEKEPERKQKYLSYEDKKNKTTFYSEIHDIEENVEFNIGNIKIKPFVVYHDAKKTLGFVFNDNELAWVTDCGFLSFGIKEQIKNCKNIAIEMNYDIKMLINSSRHWLNKLRVIGKFGHLDHEEAITFIKKLPSLDNLITLHPSNEHLSLGNLEEKLKELTNVKNIHISQRENNNTIDLEVVENVNDLQEHKDNNGQ